MDQMEWLRIVLANDEVSTDEELIQLFVEEGVDELAAREAVAHRWPLG